MATSNPATLTDATRFRPVSFRAHSRSPSRSPVRKAQFTAQHLDPLLSNLSPDSTLKALQATETIPTGTTQDALTDSIADASPSEREIGIRAAFAAQKLREWRREISLWTWPNARDRSSGAGFLPPQDVDYDASSGQRRIYVGCLPLALVDQYAQRMDEIKDALESLEMDDIKDHVLEAHVPSKAAVASTDTPKKSGGPRKSYGRMRDFTALITATVIQALPDLANLNMLLETWEVRLGVLRQLPMTLDVFEAVKAGVSTAIATIQDPEQAAMVTKEDFETTRAILGKRISDLGSRIDKLLDFLEGHEDSLPQAWIDSLENIENEYATWVVDGQHLVTRNGLATKVTPEIATIANDEPTLDARPTTAPSRDEPSAIPESAHLSSIDPHGTKLLPEDILSVSPPNDEPTLDARPATALSPDEPSALPESTHLLAIDPHGTTLLPEDSLSVSPPNDESEARGSLSQHKSSLTLDVPPARGHKKNVSEVSVADSTLSAFSDMSNAEIVDARSTLVLASPKINLVDNPFRSSRDDLAWFGSPETEIASAVRPTYLQRASTASIEVIPKDLVKKVTLSRSMSNDLLTQIAPSPDSTPSRALQQLVGEDPTESSAVPGLPPPPGMMRFQDQTGPSSPLPSPSLIVEPLKITSKSPDDQSPNLPRKSSKRYSLGASTLMSEANVFTPAAPSDSNGFIEPVQPPVRPKSSPRKSAMKATEPGESLEAKIQGILTSLPANIRMAQEGDSEESTQPSSGSSTGASTPTPVLTLSPVKSKGRASVGGLDVRLFHLTQHGQSRDTPPVKLFVRAVGEDGERVMVRIGGGWADLGEYLREYSLHHGRRSVEGGQFEVAQYPGKAQKEAAAGNLSVLASGSTRTSTGFHKRKSKSFSTAQLTSDAGLSAEGNAQDGRAASRLRSPEPIPPSIADYGAWTPPPVPPIPATYTTHSPTLSTTMQSNGQVETRVSDDEIPSQIENSEFGHKDSNAKVSSRSSTIVSPGVTTTTAILNPENSSHAKYTPLGAAGPKNIARRSVTYGAPAPAVNEAWVQGMVGKARAVSSNVVHGPTTTTTTTTTSTMTSSVSTSTPTSRRASAFISSSPVSSYTAPSPATPTPKNSLNRPKSRLSLGDVSGIKRVFLRRKSEK